MFREVITLGLLIIFSLFMINELVDYKVQQHEEERHEEEIIYIDKKVGKFERASKKK